MQQVGRELMQQVGRELMQQVGRELMQQVGRELMQQAVTGDKAVGGDKEGFIEEDSRPSHAKEILIVVGQVAWDLWFESKMLMNHSQWQGGYELESH
jgi:hypothetical protein